MMGVAQASGDENAVSLLVWIRLQSHTSKRKMASKYTTVAAKHCRLSVKLKYNSLCRVIEGIKWNIF
jgi:hypothetical protein